MKNEVSFVRFHFIQFAEKIVEQMLKILKKDTGKQGDFTEAVLKII